MTRLGKISGETTRKQQDVPADYSEQRYKEPRKLYPWKGTVAGRRGLSGIYLYAAQFATDDQLLQHEPKALGIDKYRMHFWLQKKVPEVFEEHLALMGKPLTAKKLSSRLYNMFRDNGRKTLAIGPEHPKNHPEVRPEYLKLEAELKA